MGKKKSSGARQAGGASLGAAMATWFTTSWNSSANTPWANADLVIESVRYDMAAALLEAMVVALKPARGFLADSDLTDQQFCANVVQLMGEIADGIWFPEQWGDAWYAGQSQPSSAPR